MLPFFFALATLPTTTTLDLYRGATLPGESIRYWDVEDTVLDAAQPDANFGGEYAMSTGTGRVVLVRYGDLERAIGRHSVKKARLVLSYSSNEHPVLHSVSRVLSSWGEGPLITLKSLKSEATPTGAPAGSATWRARQSGLAAWQSPGASGDQDEEAIKDAKMVQLNDHQIAIEGLEKAVQTMSERWFENNGFALRFDNQMDIASSQSPEGKPVLAVELGPEKPIGGPDLSVVGIDTRLDGKDLYLTAHIRNVGDKPSKGFIGNWVVAARESSAIEVGKSFEPGQEMTLDTRVPYHEGELVSFAIRPSGEDAEGNNDAAEIQEGGNAVDFAGDKSADWAQRQIRLLNHTVLAQSRFSFAPSGVSKYFNVGSVGAQLGSSPLGVTVASSSISVKPNWIESDILAAFFRKANGISTDSAPPTKLNIPDYPYAVLPSYSPYGGLLGWGDTRCENLVPTQFCLFDQGSFDPVLDIYRLEPTDLLNATAVAQLNKTTIADSPKTIILDVTDFNNQKIPNADLTFYRVTAAGVPAMTPAFTLNSGQSGSVLAPMTNGSLFPNLQSVQEAYLVKAVAHDATEWSYLPAWVLYDLSSRGATSASIIPLRFNLPTAPIDESRNLAENRIVADSLGQSPAALSALVGVDAKKSATLGDKAGDWVEIDLGRDRPISEVRLTFPGPAEFWPQFDLMVYGTGQTAADAYVWAHEKSFEGAVRRRMVDHSLAYRGLAQRFRYLRIVARQGGKATLGQVRVYAVK